MSQLRIEGNERQGAHVAEEFLGSSYLDAGRVDGRVFPVPLPGAHPPTLPLGSVHDVSAVRTRTFGVSPSAG